MEMLKQYVAKIMDGKNLSQDEAAAAMEVIMHGKAQESQLAAFLTALKLKGEASDEIAGFACTLLRHAERVEHSRPVMCNCGTGGDTKNTFNISTTVAFVLAGGGVCVAKHGNRSVSSSSGSADVLAALGVNVDLAAARVQQEIERIGIGFLFAPALNKAMRYVAKTRKELGFRTVFNLLGPIINPAHTDYQLVGIYDGALTHKIAEVLGTVGVKHAMVVHSADGMDEISTHTRTMVSELSNKQVFDYEINPAEYGFSSGSIEDYRGGTPEENAVILRDILRGVKGPGRDIVLLNAAAGFYVADRVVSLEEGLKLAVETIDSGRAMEKLDALITVSNEKEVVAV
jgi:anthranilate phosphoribosyltransferase